MHFSSLAVHFSNLAKKGENIRATVKQKTDSISTDKESALSEGNALDENLHL